MVGGYQPPCQTWLELLGKSDLPCYVMIQDGLGCGSGWMMTAMRQCHHDQGVDLEGGRQYPLGWTFVWVAGTLE